MLRNVLLLVSVALLFWLGVTLMLREPQVPSSVSAISPPAPQFDLEPIVPPVEPEAKLVSDINVHTVQELDVLFERVEQLLERPRKQSEAALITLVLHGPEVEFFVLDNYGTYRDVVDRAAKLAALGAVDIAICQTQMKNRGIASDQVPGFLRQVPYGPGEVDQLIRDGYVYM